jgi:hypothetical protein
MSGDSNRGSKFTKPAFAGSESRSESTSESTKVDFVPLLPRIYSPVLNHLFLKAC